jgi:uncharacterized protein YjiS (DUF1127 family)
MTASTYSHTAASHTKAGHTGGFLSQSAAKLQNLLTNWVKQRAQARELEDLYRFSDRELWDIGLSRSDFLSIEQGTYRRD